ncbi:hypothetical protein [Streptomyces sp. NPDC060198]|uniref:hypothetical protein n=1 Tax=Streptomyces sp. NPDC060198 TaxID=3347070 RepID=UPI003665C483
MESAVPEGSRVYEGCEDGRSLRVVEKVYGLAVPDAVTNLRFCEQDDWSGSHGEMQFDTSRNGLSDFLAASGHADLEFSEVTAVTEGLTWQKIPQGTKVESGLYVNTVDGCDNAVHVDVQALRTDAVRVYLRLVCAS